MPSIKAPKPHSSTRPENGHRKNIAHDAIHRLAPSAIRRSPPLAHPETPLHRTKSGKPANSSTQQPHFQHLILKPPTHRTKQPLRLMSDSTPTQVRLKSDRRRTNLGAVTVLFRINRIRYKSSSPSVNARSHSGHNSTPSVGHKIGCPTKRQCL